MKNKTVPTNPRAIVEFYACDDKAKKCMYGECNNCFSHGLVKNDCVDDEDSSPASDDSSICDEEELNV